MLGTVISQVGGQAVQMINFNEMSQGQLLWLSLMATAFVIFSVWLNMWIWNNVLVNYVSVIRPVRSLWDFFLLTFLIKSIFSV